MLVEFRVTNFRSIKETQVLSMVASSDRSLANNVIDTEALGRLRLNRSVAMYGANASGKSNIIAALAFVKNFVLQSDRLRRRERTEEEDAAIPVIPFLLDPQTSQEPSEFQFVFIQDGVRYQYGFAVDRQRVRSEGLIAFPKGQPQRWFERTWLQGEEYDWQFRSKEFRGEKHRIADVTRPDALYLTVGPTFDLDQLTPVYRWFRQLQVYNAPDVLRDRFGRRYHSTARRAFTDPRFHQQVRELLAHADIGIIDFKVEEIESQQSAQLSLFSDDYARSRLARYEISMSHQGVAGEEPFLLPIEEESRGTQQLFEFAYRWIETLDRGRTLVIDELGGSLHSMLSRRLVELFHDPRINRKGAQLIFNTHDVMLLDKTLFRRDQIWFTEKDREGATHLYPLLDFSPRKEESLARNYLQGRYGAIPFIEDISDWLVNDGKVEEEE